jgi:hypothetical protein
VEGGIGHVIVLPRLWLSHLDRLGPESTHTPLAGPLVAGSRTGLLGHRRQNLTKMILQAVGSNQVTG